ncbi:MAG: hypothetical protein M1822_000702 [Bathelium mastoideum]|nr:MAG: hypothetical protein M1822_000702 [Bathelium mastoideum]
MENVVSDLFNGVKSVTQKKEPGSSILGTLSVPSLPPWLNGPLSQGFPWGNRTAGGTNPYTEYPETGVTRSYTWSISNETISPDGVPVAGIVANGQFPGPMIEANWGDWIEVTVTNNLPDQGTTLHWHALLQKTTQWMDGVPAVDQCPIPPGSTFTYRFKAELYGTSWWHSHYDAQYSSGLSGPIVIHGPNNVNYDIDLGPVMMTDWYHEPYEVLVAEVMGPNNSGIIPPSNNNLINGRNNYPCNSTSLPCTLDSGVSEFRFQSGKSMRLRLVNHGAEAGQKFSIDNHNFQVIANDFVPIVPYTTNSITLGIGQRADIVVNGTGQPTDAVWMRAVACGTTDGISNEALAVVYYEDAKNGTLPTTSDPSAETCGAVGLSAGSETPFYPMAPGEPSTTINVNITAGSNGTQRLWYMNNSSFRGDYNSPTLLEAKVGNQSFAPDWNVYNTGTNSSIRMIWYNYVPEQSHPMHLHGHNIFALATGYGEYDGHIDGDPNNPTRRDVAMLAAAQDENTPAYLVVQWNQDNPGMWPFHCHIAWHIAAGFMIQIFENPNAVANLNIPSTFAQTCRDWASWTNTHVPDEIDSGL